MLTFVYLLLDGFVVCVVLVLAWYLLSKFSSLMTCSLILFKRLTIKSNSGKKKSLRQLSLCATRNVEEHDDAHLVKAETHMLTPFTEKIDWSQYDSPTFIRKGILVH